MININMKISLITGINGQDGSYLTELLLNKKYIVWGIIRRSSTFNTKRIEHLSLNKNFRNKLILKYGDITDSSCLTSILSQIKEKYCNMNVLEIYNLAAQSHVKVSFEIPEYTANTDAFGVLKLLEAIKNCGFKEKIKFYQASTSEMFGKVLEVPQKETTPFYPRSPYGVAKLYGHWITKNYRESYNMFACSGILFNHERERRGIEFVTRKISDGVTKIKLGLADHITLGNLDAERDWGYAPDYVEAMWLMLQQDKPDDYVIATGEKYSIRDFVKASFRHIGIDDWEPYVKQDAKFMRPAEVDVLRGDYSKANKNLNWKPKTSFNELVKIMIDNDLNLLK